MSGRPTHGQQAESVLAVIGSALRLTCQRGLPDSGLTGSVQFSADVARGRNDICGSERPGYDGARRRWTAIRASQVLVTYIQRRCRWGTSLVEGRCPSGRPYGRQGCLLHGEGPGSGEGWLG